MGVNYPKDADTIEEKLRVLQAMWVKLHRTPPGGTNRGRTPEGREWGRRLEELKAERNRLRELAEKEGTFREYRAERGSEFDGRKNMLKHELAELSDKELDEEIA
jgi:ribosomal protein L19E